MPSNKVKLCDSFCKDCVFSTRLCGDALCCDYYLITGVRRPCLARSGCAVKKKGRRKSWTATSNLTQKGTTNAEALGK